MLAPAEFREHLKENVPESQFETTREWIVALKREIDHVFIPRVRGRRPDPQGYAIAAAELLASETKMEELATEERLDASLDRALKKDAEAVGTNRRTKDRKWPIFPYF